MIDQKMTQIRYYCAVALAIFCINPLTFGQDACKQSISSSRGVLTTLSDSAPTHVVYQPLNWDDSNQAKLTQEPSAESAPVDCPPEASSAGTQIGPPPTLFGEWMGIKPSLAQRGILAEADLTQFYQGVAGGGNEQAYRYGAKMNLMLLGDTEKMGLWKGGKIIFHAAEWQFGQNAVADAVGLAPVNTNLLLPEPSPSFAITHLQLVQGLTETGWAATAGRYNLLDLWTAFYPDYGRGLDGFMNTASLIPINAVAPGLPPVSNVFGVLKEGKAGPEAAFLVFESQNSPSTIGLDFPNGVTLLGALRRNMTNGRGLPSSHMLAATCSTGRYTSLNTNDWVILPGGIVRPGEQRGSWFAGYFGEQRLWQDPCNEKRYTKLYGYAGLADRDTSPYEWTGGLTLEKHGPTATRPGDRMGIGYFYNSLSGPLEDLATPIADLQDVHGGEVYYNAAITPWFHLTFDVQAIQSDNQDCDTALVLGLRGKLDF